VQLKWYTEECYTPINFPNLLPAKKKTSKWCIYCILYQGTHVGHMVDKCPKAPGIGATLNGYIASRLRFTQAKKTSGLPGKGLICFYCWWPLSMHHSHLIGKWPDVCCSQDQIPQLCWLAFCDPELCTLVGTYFQLPAEILGSVMQYWKWICSTRREVKWVGHNSGLTNIQCVYLYFYYVACPVMG
jgi:hypothetical protein